MKAARIHGYEATPILEDVPTPNIGPDEILLRVVAASLNPLDVKLQKGWMHAFFPLDFPYTMGTDLAGTIERVGSGVAGWREGDHVVARVDPTRGGALAELAVVPASYLVEVPTSVPIEQAAGIPTAGGTAWQALFEVADLSRGQTVLVHAGASGVGACAIQLARSVGARVIATASGTGVEIARRLGADHVIDYRSASFAAKVSDVDVVLDSVGGATQQLSFEVLRAGGTLLALTSPPDEALAEAHNVTASFVAHASDARRLKQVVGRVDAGMEILVDRAVSLTSLDAALVHQGSGRARGKILLTI